MPRTPPEAQGDTSTSRVPIPQSPTSVLTAPIDTLKVGCKLKVNRVDSEEWRLAEILCIRTHPSGQREFYVHYADFNKRLDEWVGARRLDLKYVEWPREAATPQKHGKRPVKRGTLTGRHAAQKGPQKSAQKGPYSSPLARKANKAPQKLALKAPQKAPQKGPKSLQKTPIVVASSRKRRRLDDQGDEDDDEDALDSDRELSGTGNTSFRSEDDFDDGEVSLQSGAGGSGTGSRPGTASGTGVAAMEEEGDTNGEGQGFTREEEFERLRTSGSMTQSVSEISRLKNLRRVQIGHHVVEPWYFAPYPEEYTQAPVVYICEFCLSHFCSEKSFSRHRTKCLLRHPPGNEIYRDGSVSFWEIDGRKQKHWCRNLCLLSKCFLDHKTLYFDVDPFLFYILTESDGYGAHIVGYFSKEKESTEGYNVACILTLPQYQRKGWGKVLIQFSYLLSRVEKRLGSPEKPLSDLGLLSYRAYWTEVLMEELIPRVGSEASIEELASRTSMTPLDVQHTLQALGALKDHVDQHIIALTKEGIQQHEKVKNRPGRRLIKPECLQWKPPTFGFQDRFAN